jgi:valyl-tRNA synthetase
MAEMQKTYAPHDREARQYHDWESKGYFQPKGEGQPFSIVIPPPNVTGALHLGHALEQTLIDVLVRTRRMKGDNVLWLPGTDHAGIATQNVVERELAKAGQTRHALGREAFIDRVWEWKEEYGNRITHQMRRLGISIDWSRERFTMDAGCGEAVYKTFESLHARGLLYRGAYIINWCPRCTTALSDIEVEHEEAQGSMWHIRYRVAEGVADYVTVATTRPETMFGDQAVAVHPEDERYAHLIGQFLELPLTGRRIPIVGDSAVDPTFGTGAVKVTPAHDPNDFEIGQRHGLSPLLVMDSHGVMNDEVPEAFRGMDRMACRKALVAALDVSGNLVSTQPHTLSRGHCYRCKTVIEPYLSKQWFVKMSALAEDAIKVVADKTIEFVPARYEKLYFDWMENIREWCVSRQIWWGHRIPVWYPEDAPEAYVVSQDMPQDGRVYTQDPDVLDTWFSSALWPFSTMGWPEKTADMAAFYPTTMLVTGYDILTFWVSRMVTMGLALTEKAPFATVYIHGLVRDSQGKKMSKSTGNVVDPLEMIDRYGADALRFSLASLATFGGQDIRFSEEKVETSRNFANKLWNASRFVLMTLDQLEMTVDFAWPTPVSAADHWLLSRFTQTLKTVEQCFEQYNFALATESLWDFFWNVTCDWYLEVSKQDKVGSLPMLVMAVLKSAQLLHPYMPFITDEIWQLFRDSGRVTGMPTETIMLSAWPTFAELPAFDAGVAARFAVVTDVIREIRYLRQQANIAPVVAVPVSIQGPGELVADLELATDILTHLAKVSVLSVLHADDAIPAEASAAAVGALRLYLHIGDVIDKAAERKRLSKEIERLDAAIVTLKTRLSDPGFLAKAPAAVVEKNKVQLTQWEDELTAFSAQRASFA